MPFCWRERRNRQPNQTPGTKKGTGWEHSVAAANAGLHPKRRERPKPHRSTRANRADQPQRRWRRPPVQVVPAAIASSRGVGWQIQRRARQQLPSTQRTRSIPAGDFACAPATEKSHPAQRRTIPPRASCSELSLFGKASSHAERSAAISTTDFLLGRHSHRVAYGVEGALDRGHGQIEDAGRVNCPEEQRKKDRKSTRLN